MVPLMPSSRMHRAVGLLAAVSLTTGLAACGGDSGGSEDDYAKVWNTACTDLTKAQTTLQSDLVALQGKFKANQEKQALQAAGKPVSSYISTMETVLKRIDDADAPESWKKFDEGVTGNISKISDAFDKAKSALAQGDAKGFQAAFSSSDLQKLNGSVEAPQGLKDKAPACSAL